MPFPTINKTRLYPPSLPPSLCDPINDRAVRELFLGSKLVESINLLNSGGLLHTHEYDCVGKLAFSTVRNINFYH